mmetsp:Transcript_15181/g.30848  ORF Transcript_15181/g.30848 Transcript_15181/m.30848 type:complete len:619 (-) Transcript_15181:228-2084(-)
MPGGLEPRAGNAASDDDVVRRILIEYLHKKGYRRAEQALLEDTGLSNGLRGDPVVAVDDELRNVVLLIGSGSSTELDARLFDDAYCELRDWIDGSLDIYKAELHSILYPFLVHCFLELVRIGAADDARNFLLIRGAEFQDDVGSNPSRKDEMTALAGITAPLHLQENHVARLFLDNRYEIHFTAYAFELLTAFLTGDLRRIPLLRLLNQRCCVLVDSATSSRSKVGFSIGAEASATQSRPVLWGRLRPELYHILEESRDPRNTGSTEPELGRERDANSEPAVPQVDPAGWLTMSQIPLPKYRAGSPALPVPASPNRVELTRSEPPSTLFLTVLNDTGVGGLNCVTVSETGSLVAGGTGDSSVWLWDNQNGSTSSLAGHSGPVYAIDLSPCTRYLLSGSEDGTVRLWSVHPTLRTALVAFRGHNYPVWSCQFSALGYYFASGSHDRTARVWCTERVAPLRVLAGHLADVDCVRWHPNCNYLATGSSDRTCRLWDVRTGDCVRVLSSLGNSVQSIDFCPLGRSIAVADADGAIQIIDIAEGRTLQTFRGHSGCVWSLAYSRETGNVLASGGADGSVQIWAKVGKANGEDPIVCYRTKKTPVQLVKFTPKNLLLAVGSFRG